MLADPLSHDPLDSFTDREQLVQLVEHCLRAAQPGRLRLLAVTGNSGTGKTFLISYLTTHVCPALHWPSGQLSFAQSRLDFRAIVAGLEAALKGCVPRASLNQYRAKRDDYHRRFDDYRAAITVTQRVEASTQSSVSNVTQTTQINVQLHERELQLRSELTRALLELAEESTQPLCLFIDSYERLAETAPELDAWLWEEVVVALTQAAPQPLVVVTCGWERPGNAAITPFIQAEALTDFNEVQVRSYLEKHTIIPSAEQPLTTEQQELVASFHELTKGHPLVLGLAVAYFNQLSSQERTAEVLRAKRPLLDEQARVAFLDERLLSRLPEPHRTLLERGPILRAFDRQMLQVLLALDSEGATAGSSVLDERSYARFLRYPFLNQEQQGSGNASQVASTFHSLVRRVRLEALRHLYPDSKAQLHRAMVEYYRQRVEEEREQEAVHRKQEEEHGVSREESAVWLVEMSEPVFRAHVEYLYHALQLRAHQAEAFATWQASMGQAIDGWRRQQAETLLEVIEQLVEEGEPFLSAGNEPYGRYLLWSARSLEQDLHWQEAQVALEKAAQVFEQGGNQVDYSTALNNLALLYDAQGNYAQAEPLYQRALAICEQVLGPRHPNTASSLNNLALLYDAQGNYAQAEPLYQRALAMWEQVLGPRHPDTAQSLNNLAALYYAQGNYPQAEPLMKRALAMWEQVLGPRHPDTAGSLNNLAELYRAQGNYAQAEPLMKRALAICEQVLGPLHPDTASSLNNLAALYRAQGNYAQAEPLYQRALAISEEVLGPLHPHTAQSLNNLAGLYHAQGNYPQAEPLMKRALAMWEQVLGPRHPNTATSLNNLAELYRAQGNYAQAEPLMKRALAIREQVLAPLHPDTAQSLNNLAALYYAQGNYPQAEPLMKRALAMWEQVLGPQHPDTATSLNNLAELYRAQGHYKQAEPLYQRALAIWEQVLGPRHPNTATSLNNLAELYRAQGHYAQAEPLYQRSLAIYEQVLGPRHPETAQSLNNLAALYYAQGHYAQAEPLMKRALAICEQVLGPRHPDTATIRANYTFLLEKMKERKTEGAGSQDEGSQPQ